MTQNIHDDAQATAARLEELEHQVNRLGQALGECIVAAGIIRPDASLTGPELLMFAQDLKTHLESSQKQALPLAAGLGWEGSLPPPPRNVRRHKENHMTGFNVVPHPRLKRDYTGKRVRTLRELRNGWGIVPVGSYAVIDHQSPKGSSLVIDACSCCALKPVISGIQASDIEFIEC